MENLGIHLQNLREEQGISFQKVFDDLRIREEQVRMIEENRFFELGPFGFSKTMVYNYARYLGADLDEVMAEFSVMVPEHTKKPAQADLGTKERKIMLSPNLLWLLGIILFVLILGGILMYAHSQGRLKPPEFLKRLPADSTAVEKEVEPEPEQESQLPQPDLMREIQKNITKNLPANGEEAKPESQTQKKPVKDSTDHVGELMGPSQVGLE
ncbi:MAG: hypothetical protein GXY81_08590 [Candidatus Cloacimonetes bacterium]|nr:hypothetical protein [Candidatus Cloacimonadota bacterium]